MHSGKFSRFNLVFSFVFTLFLLGFSPSAHADRKELDEIKQKVHEHGARWVAAETSISKLPPEERVKRLGLNNGVNAAVPGGAIPLTAALLPLATAPVTLDYRAYNYVTPVKNQGSCGSCWAFAVTAALESQLLIKTATTMDISEQTLVSCGGSGSCSGGYVSSASNFIQTTGLPVENCFPYTATNSSCANACANWQSNTYRVSNWQNVSATVDALKNALINYGPLVTTFAVYSDFYYYTSGVYSFTSGTLQGHHAVELIGYDDAAQAFLVKNSWGTGWGEGGFFRIAYSQMANAVGFGQSTLAYNVSVTPTCSYSITPTSVSVPYTGISGTVQVGAPTGCAWTAQSNTSWATITSGASGSGNSTVAYTVPANTSAGRSGTMTIAGKSFTLAQGGTYEIAPKSATYGKTGGSGTVVVSSQIGLTWTAKSNASWITITSGANGTGTGSVNYTVAPNTTKKNRTGTMTIAGLTFTVTETRR